MKQTATSLLLAPPLLLVLLLMLGCHGPAMALDCGDNISILDNEDVATIYTIESHGLRKDKIVFPSHNVSLYVQPLPGFRGVSVEVLSGDGGWLDITWCSLNDACFTTPGRWWKLILTPNMDLLVFSIVNCRSACTHKMFGNTSSYEKVQFRAHGTSGWRFQRPGKKCRPVDIIHQHYPRHGPHQLYQNLATMEEESTSTLTLLVVVVVILQVVLVVIVVVLVVMQRQQRQLTVAEEPIYDYAEPPRQEVDASLSIRNEDVDEDIYDELELEPSCAAATWGGAPPNMNDGYLDPRSPPFPSAGAKYGAMEG